MILRKDTVRPYLFYYCNLCKTGGGDYSRIKLATKFIFKFKLVIFRRDLLRLLMEKAVMKAEVRHSFPVILSEGGCKMEVE
jgi:hypothetical protein